jgi:hypothetical protein
LMQCCTFLTGAQVDSVRSVPKQREEQKFDGRSGQGRAPSSSTVIPFGSNRFTRTCVDYVGMSSPSSSLTTHTGPRVGAATSGVPLSMISATKVTARRSYLIRAASLMHTSALQPWQRGSNMWTSSSWCSKRILVSRTRLLVLLVYRARKVLTLPSLRYR